MANKFENFKWEDSLKLGVDSMDKEHQVLIDKMNKFISSLNLDDIKTQYMYWSDLGRYVVEHFTNEEAYMEKIGFDGLATHKIIHKQLLDKVGEFSIAIEKGEFDKNNLVIFLKTWLKSHIIGIDGKYCK